MNFAHSNDPYTLYNRRYTKKIDAIRVMINEAERYVDYVSYVQSRKHT